MKTRVVVIRVFSEAGYICQHQVWSGGSSVSLNTAGDVEVY